MNIEGLKIQNLALVIGLAASGIYLSGCAGSATHKVVTANQAGDTSLTCKQIDSEIVKTQVIIDGVNEDKADMSGADVMDGILWFPFNLIAKDGNYKNALEAADKRIAQLNEMSKGKGCITSNADLDKEPASISTDLRELNKLYKEGAITEEEYKVGKSKLLDKL